MKTIIRFMTKEDKEKVLEMMRIFYNSPAVYTNGSDEIFLRDIENCINDNPFLEGYIFETSGNIEGYAMIAKSFSTEFGKSCIWLEDLYILDEYRGNGLGGLFLDFIFDKYKNCVFRLDIEEDNEKAIALYKKKGFDILPYMQMKK